MSDAQNSHNSRGGRGFAPRGRGRPPRQRGGGRGGNNQNWRMKTCSNCGSTDHKTEDCDREPFEQAPASLLPAIVEDRPGNAPPKEGEQPKFKINLSFALNEKDRKRCQVLWPNYHLISKDFLGTPADHPFVAIERTITEMSMVNRLKRYDHVGVLSGNPGRLKKIAAGPGFHCINPILEPKDDVEQIFAEMVADAKVCQHDYLECDCHTYDAFMNLYGVFTPEQILAITHKTTKGVFLYACRQFKDVLGTMSEGEIVYTRDLKMVTMHVKGNPTAYRIPSETWIFETNHFAADGKAISWSIIDTFHDTRVVLFAVSNMRQGPQYALPLSGLSFADAMTNFSAYGPIESDLRGIFAKDAQLATRFEEARLGKATFFSFYGWFQIGFDFGEDERIFVPKGAIAKVATHVSLRPREPALFNSAVQVAKQALQEYRMPPDWIQAAVAPTAIIGFYKDVGREGALLATAVTKHQEATTGLNHLLALKETFVVPQYATFGALAGALVIGGMAATWYTKRLNARVNTLSIALMQAKNAINEAQAKVNLAELVQEIKHERTLRPPPQAAGSILSFFNPLAAIQTLFLWFTYNVVQPAVKLPSHIPSILTRVCKQGTHTITRVYKFATRMEGVRAEVHAPVHYPDICMQGRLLTKMHSSAQVKLPIDTSCVEHHGVTQFGFGTPIRVPLMARSCVHNEEVAVRNRGCLNRPDPNEGFYSNWVKDLRDMLPLVNGTQYIVNGKLKPFPFQDWVRRFPPGRRTELMNAREGMRHAGRKAKPMIKAFVKREHQLKSFPEVIKTRLEFPDCTDYDPRQIQGRHPEYQVMTGPASYSYTKYVAYMWHAQATPHKHHRLPREDKRPMTNIVYTSGMNAEQLGKLIQQSVQYITTNNDHVEVWFFENDANRFDAHCNTEAIKLINDFYQRARLKKKYWRCMEWKMKTKGVTKCGIFYIVEATVQSGNGDTSVGDTVVTGSGHERIARRVDLLPSQYLILSCGDDILIPLASTHATQYYKASQKYWEEAGFSMAPILVKHIWDAEFCSGRIYPTKDGWVYGPKVGRVLCKTFYSKIDYSDQQGARWLRAVALGLEKDTYFIPVLRTVVRKTIELTEGRKALHIWEEQKIHAKEIHEAADETYAMMEHLYGLDRAAIVELETWLEQVMTALPISVTHPYITTIVDRDVPLAEQPRRTQVAVYGNVLKPLLSMIKAILSPNTWMAIIKSRGARETAKLTGAIFFGVSTYGSYTIMNPQPSLFSPESMPLYASPILEEVGGYFWAKLPFWISVYEFLHILYTQEGNLPLAVMAYAPSALMHVLTYFLGNSPCSILLRITYHMAYNSGVHVAHQQGALDPASVKVDFDVMNQIDTMAKEVTERLNKGLEDASFDMDYAKSEYNKIVQNLLDEANDRPLTHPFSKGVRRFKQIINNCTTKGSWDSVIRTADNITSHPVVAWGRVFLVSILALQAFGLLRPLYERTLASVQLVADSVQRWTTRAWNRLMHSINGNATDNYKNRLQERLQKQGRMLPVYVTHTTDSGFLAECKLKEPSPVSMFAEAGNKTSAEQQAARLMLEHLDGLKTDNSVMRKLTTDAGTWTTRLCVTLSTLYAWDRLFLDLDNVTPLTEFYANGRTLYAAGTATSVHGWRHVIPTLKQKFAKCYLQEVPVKPDAADECLLAAMKAHPDNSLSVLVTKDKDLIRKAQALGPIQVAPELPDAMFNPVAMSKSIPESLALLLMEFIVARPPVPQAKAEEPAFVPGRFTEL